MAQTITIELRVDFDTCNKKEKEPIMLAIAKQCAKELITKAMMIKDSREPQIIISDGDFFCETREVQMFSANEEAEDDASNS
jgi:hypothetical protein